MAAFPWLQNAGISLKFKVLLLLLPFECHFNVSPGCIKLHPLDGQLSCAPSSKIEIPKLTFLGSLQTVLTTATQATEHTQHPTSQHIWDIHIQNQPSLHSRQKRCPHSSYSRIITSKHINTYHKLHSLSMWLH